MGSMVRVALPQYGTPSAPPPAPRRADGPLRDAHGRTIRDLRLSVTDRCNFRCTYCLEPGARFLPKESILDASTLVRLAAIALRCGVEKIRLTGGEPMLRDDLPRIVEGIARLAPHDLAMTTNGSLADERSLRRLRDAGLGRVTISIDAVEPEAFARATRSTSDPQRVLEAIEAAIAVGFREVKLNAVLIRGRNEDQALPLAALARRHGIEMRFIEFMPLDHGRRWDRSLVVSADEVLGTIGAVHALEPIGRADPSATSETYRFRDGAAGAVGVIAPVTRPFCGACSRLRITAEGAVRPCLFARDEWPLRPLLEGGADDERIERFLADAVHAKQAGHGIGDAAFAQPERTMSAIGG